MKNQIKSIKAAEDELLENRKRLDDMNSVLLGVKIMLKNLTTVYEMGLNASKADEYKALNDWLRTSKISAVVKANDDTESEYDNVVELV